MRSPALRHEKLKMVTASATPALTLNPAAKKPSSSILAISPENAVGADAWSPDDFEKEEGEESDVEQPENSPSLNRLTSKMSFSEPGDEALVAMKPAAEQARPVLPAPVSELQEKHSRGDAGRAAAAQWNCSRS
jgi:hypothetical protein